MKTKSKIRILKLIKKKGRIGTGNDGKDFIQNHSYQSHFIPSITFPGQSNHTYLPQYESVHNDPHKLFIQRSANPTAPTSISFHSLNHISFITHENKLIIKKKCYGSLQGLCWSFSKKPLATCMFEMW